MPEFDFGRDGRGRRIGGGLVWTAEGAFCDGLLLEETLKTLGLSALETEGLLVLCLCVHGVRTGAFLAAYLTRGRIVGERMGDEGSEGGLCDEVVFANMLEGGRGATSNLDLSEVGGLAGRETWARAGGRVLVDAEGSGWAGDVGFGGVGLEPLAEGMDRAHRAWGRRRRQGRRRRRQTVNSRRAGAGKESRASVRTLSRHLRGCFVQQRAYQVTASQP